jgi:bacteriorhodopsin
MREVIGVLVVAAIVLFCPVAAATIAHQKGRSALLWAFFGFFLGIFGVIFALIARPRHA